MRLVSTMKKAVRDRLIARAGGIDLTRLDKVPDSLSWPLQREVMAPSRRLSEIRDVEPVHKLTSFLGLDVWVVTGDAEAREVLQRHHVVLHRHPPLHGQERVRDRR